METEQQTETGEGEAITRSLSSPHQVQASLEAVRTAQAAARARARRETRWARLVALGALMAVGATAWAAAHRAPRKHAAPAPAVAAAPAPAPLEAPPAAEIALSPPEVLAPPVAATPPKVAVPVDTSAQRERCDAAFAERRWPAVATTCADAFAALPADSALAMRVAQAEHRRGHVADAAVWAQKALALNAGLPEAYVLVGRAEKTAGNARAAAEAYRHYLTLAPRGWHAAEARRASHAAR
jgi:hypothetical protein